MSHDSQTATIASLTREIENLKVRVNDLEEKHQCACEACDKKTM